MMTIPLDRNKPTVKQFFKKQENAHSRKKSKLNEFLASLAPKQATPSRSYKKQANGIPRELRTFI